MYVFASWGVVLLSPSPVKAMTRVDGGTFATHLMGSSLLLQGLLPILQVVKSQGHATSTAP